MCADTAQVVSELLSEWGLGGIWVSFSSGSLLLSHVVDAILWFWVCGLETWVGFLLHH